ncbi:MAG: hypothetical protein KDM81_03460 [Verrucomicrobiae bacterium]|nr:hypothetical protein [Verrucomicrobiae bacterium]MCP5523916.1 hypothetical protein [Verrucomicrobiales bacterium]
MIQLRSDCLVFKTAEGAIPCSAEYVAVELMGDSAKQLDAGVLHSVAAGVLHYFRDELCKDAVSVAEFSDALARVLQGFGFEVTVDGEEVPAAGTGVTLELAITSETDLHALAAESGAAFELSFFPLLRREIHRHLREGPGVVRFTGLRPCVKQLVGAQRWCGRCRLLNDQIVDYLRNCLDEEHPRNNCALLVM